MSSQTPSTDYFKVNRQKLDDAIEYFELEWNRTGEAAVDDFLPVAADPEFESFAVELLRVDLERRWKSGSVRSIAEYRDLYPELLERPRVLERLAFEEYRLRKKNGDSVTPADYARRFHIQTDHWPEPSALPETTSTLAREAFSNGIAHEMNRITSVAHEFPQAGEEVFGFSIERVLGKCRYGRVYLARQSVLANRLVVIKLTSNLWGESDRLAKLQHSNIVPVYSVHQRDGLQAVCMPFLGTHTLNDLLSGESGSTQEPVVNISGADFLKRLSISNQSAASTEHRQFLESLDFEPLCTWLVARIANGLAHAHERNIQHRDLKPSNILVTDDGQPMILDFNLSVDTASQAKPAILVGGTLPYMAPEHLSAVVAEGQIDERSDLYSLGVILFQLTTGQLPFPTRKGSLIENLGLLMKDRSSIVPSAAKLNPRISTDLDSIVQHCLAADPQDRYQSSRQLQEDLDRHFNDRPLKHAKNRSALLRSKKWLKRNTFQAALITGGTFLIASLCLALLLFNRSAKLASYEAQQRFHQFQEAHDIAISVSGLPSQHKLGNAANLLSSALTYYDDKEASANFTRLSSEQRSAVIKSRRRLYLLQAQRYLQLAAQSDVSGKQRHFQNAQRDHAKAQTISHEPSAAVLLQQAVIAEQLGKSTEAQDARNQATDLIEKGIDTDPELTCIALIFNKETATASRVMQSIDENGDFIVELIRGHYHLSIGSFVDAEMHYNACVKMRPDFYLPLYSRGLVRYYQEEFEQAEADFSKAIHFESNLRSLYANRALCRIALHDYQAAMNDLTKTIVQNDNDCWPYLMRAKIWRRMNNEQNAISDLQQAFQLPAATADGWVQRGLARLPDDPKAAIADFDQALQKDPAFVKAMLNKAQIQSKTLNDREAALLTLNRLLQIDPTHATALFGRGLLYARSGDQVNAVADAKAALQSADTPYLTYQVSRIYAQLAQYEHQFGDAAMRLLRNAIRRNATLGTFAATDAELDPLNERTDFQQLLKAARMLNQ